MNNKYLQLFVAFIIGAAISGFCVFFVLKNYSHKKNKINFVEIVEYKLSKGITEEDHKKTNYNLNGELKSVDGFISRKLVKAQDDKFYDIVEWKDAQSYTDAQNEMIKNEIAQQYFNQIDQKSVKIINADVVSAFYKNFCNGRKCKKNSKNLDQKTDYEKSKKLYKNDENYKDYKKYKKCLKKAKKDSGELNDDDCTDAKAGFDAFIAKNGDVFQKSKEDKKNHHKNDENSNGKYSK